MKIIVDKVLKDSKYTAQFSVELTVDEQAAVDAFGDKEVNFGGSIPGSPAFVLADEHRYLKAGLPWSLTIDGNGDADAKSKANSWIAEITTRLTAAKSALMSVADDFSGDVVTTV